MGHAEAWDDVKVVGSIQNRDCLLAYRKIGKTLAVASINRDVDSLRVQIAMDRDDVSAVEAIIRGQ